MPARRFPAALVCRSSKLLSKDEARRIAANIAKLPERLNADNALVDAPTNRARPYPVRRRITRTERVPRRHTNAEETLRGGVPARRDVLAVYTLPLARLFNRHIKNFSAVLRFRGSGVLLRFRCGE
jgi:hypothetical protein